VDFILKGSDATGVNVMAEEVQTTFTETTLLRIDDDAVVAKTFEDKTQVL
jgi:hypothetical protein